MKEKSLADLLTSDLGKGLVVNFGDFDYLILLKIFLIGAITFYLIFSLVIGKQTALLSTILKTKVTPLLSIVSFGLIGAAVCLLLLALFIL